MKFKIGEIAIIANTVKFPEVNGLECEIIGFDVLSKDYEGSRRDYLITIPGFPSDDDDGNWCIDEAYLRKKFDKGDWKILEDELGWNPTKEKANT